MTRVLRFRRGNSDDHSSFIGAEGEVTVNIDRDCLVVHDGVTYGGYEHVNLHSNQRLLNKDIVAIGLSVTGISTLGNTTVGGGTTELVVDGDARITGILTIGTSSITIDGLTNTLTVPNLVVTNNTTGVVASGVAVTVRDNGAAVGSANVIDFGDNLSVSFSAGIATITASGGGGDANYTNVAGVSTSVIGGIASVTQLTVSGLSTFSGITTVTGSTLFTKQLSSSGIVTASSFVRTGGTSTQFLKADGSIDSSTYATQSYVGLSTVGLASVSYVDNKVGLSTVGLASVSYVDNKVGLSTVGLASVSYVDNKVGLSTVNLASITYVNTGIAGVSTQNVRTNSLVVSGISTLGDVTTLNIFSSGIVTATTFVGNFSGSITDATNLTGGYANASSLSVSGVATISQGRIQANAASNLRFGNLPVGSGSAGRNIALGDQVLVSLNGGQGRNIGIGELSYYDTTSGQYNIGLGIQAGQKITTGSYNVIIGGYNGQTGLDIRTSSNNVVIADGEGNIRQYINSSGNVGIKTTTVTDALTIGGSVSADSYSGSGIGLTNIPAGELTGSLPAIDGSALIGVVATGTGVEVREFGSPVGTAGTIDFGTGLNVTFGSGIATVSSSISGINTSGTSTFNRLSVSGVSTFNLINVSGVSTFNSTVNLNGATFIPSNQSLVFGSNKLSINYNSTGYSLISNGSAADEMYISGDGAKYITSDSRTSHQAKFIQGGAVELYYGGNKKFETTGVGVSVYGDVYAPTGIITATTFSGSGSGLTNLPAGQLTGTLPALDGSALINLPAQPGDGVVVWDDTVNVGSARTLDFGTGLDVEISGGIATVTASGGSLQSRTTVSGTTLSIANNGIGNTNIAGFKSYALMKVGLSTAGWLRLYTDSTSRANDVSRSVGEDPQPGSGVIAEVVTTGISTTQIISPFVMGGNLDNPADTTIYAAITNLSGSTQAITANLTILQLEA